MTSSWIMWSIISLIAGSLVWIVGDALIVGFTRPRKNGDYDDFIDFMGNDNFAYQLSGSEPRLRAGALIANFSVPLLIFSALAQWALLKDSLVGQVAVVLYTLSFVYAPLAHAAFYPLGEASKLANSAFRAEHTAAKAERAHAQNMYRFLTWAWTPTITLMLIGGILIAITIALGYTAFPRWAALFTPPVMTVVASQISRVPYPGRPALDGAAFNIGALVWAISMAVLSQFYPLSL